jgi:hypothetical protein
MTVTLILVALWVAWSVWDDMHPDARNAALQAARDAAIDADPLLTRRTS